MSEKYLDLTGLTRYDGKIKTWVGNYTYSQSEVQALISAIKTIQIQVVQSLPPVSEGQTNVIYLVAKSSTGTNNYYYEYIFTGTAYELIGDTEVDLSNYYTKSQTDTLLNGKVSVVSGKGLSTNDFTTALLNKLNGIEAGATATTSITSTEIDALFS